MGKTKDELQARNREIQDRMGAMNDSAYKENREFNEAEQREWDMLSREYTLNTQSLKAMATEREMAKMIDAESKNVALREYLRGVKAGTKEREILLFPATGNTTANITASGAINLTIHDLIPTLHEGLDLPAQLRIVTGVTGNEIWPVNVDDVEMEEVGEVASLTDQVVNFANITPQQQRVGLTVPVSNMAIDNAAFDLMAFVQAKFTIALRKYLAKKIYSQAAWTGNKGPFSGLASSGTIDIAGNAYKSILKAVAEFSDKGFFEGDVVIILDRVTEAELKATPKLAGAAAGFVIENGLCAGYPYVVTHYLNTTLDGSGNLVATSDKSIGIGYFEWFALQQHGEVRFTVDPISGAKKNVTQLTLNSAWSMTDLSTHINGGDPQTSGGVTTYPTQAFALYKVVDSGSSNEIGG
jgi:hypothetical protein